MRIIRFASVPLPLRRQKLRPVLARQRFGLRFQRRRGCRIEFGGGRRPAMNRDPDGREEILLTSRGTHTQQPCRTAASVLKRVRCVGRDIDGFARSHNGLRPSEGSFDLPIQNREHLLEIVTMGRRAASRRDEHIDQGVAAGGILARKQNRVCPAGNCEVLQ